MKLQGNSHWYGKLPYYDWRKTIQSWQLAVTCLYTAVCEMPGWTLERSVPSSDVLCSLKDQSPCGGVSSHVCLAGVRRTLHCKWTGHPQCTATGHGLKQAELDYHRETAGTATCQDGDDLASQADAAAVFFAEGNQRHFDYEPPVAAASGRDGTLARLISQWLGAARLAARSEAAAASGGAAPADGARSDELEFPWALKCQGLDAAAR